MTEFSPIRMEANPRYLNEAPFFPNNKTYLVNGFTKGIFQDVLEMLQDKLNFTYDMYKREEVSWGQVYKYPNGTIIGTGIVGDVFFKRADMAVTSLTVTKERKDFVDFLPPIENQFIALFIPSDNVSENMDFETFLAPFHLHLWLVIALTGFVFAALLSMMKSSNRNELAKEMLHNSWISMTVFLGGGTSLDSNIKKESQKVLIFTSLVCGYIIWICYNAFLTAELSDIEKRFPFNSLETLSQSNWR